MVFISFFPFIQACFVVLFKRLRVDSIRAILGLGDLRAGSLPTSSTSSTSSSSLCSLSSSFFHHLDHCLDMYYSCFILYISIIFLLKVSTWVFISFVPIIQAHFVFLFELLRVDGVCAILGLGDRWAGSLPMSSTSSTSLSLLCSLSSCSFSSSGSLFSVW